MFVSVLFLDCIVSYHLLHTSTSLKYNQRRLITFIIFNPVYNYLFQRFLGAYFDVFWIKTEADRKQGRESGKTCNKGRRLRPCGHAAFAITIQLPTRSVFGVQYILIFFLYIHLYIYKQACCVFFNVLPEVWYMFLMFDKLNNLLMLIWMYISGFFAQFAGKLKKCNSIPNEEWNSEQSVIASEVKQRNYGRRRRWVGRWCACVCVAGESAGGWGVCIMRSGGVCSSQWRQRGFVRV